MIKRTRYHLWIVSILALLSLIAHACSSGVTGAPSLTPTQPIETISPAVTDTPLPPTDTPIPDPLAILLAPQGADPALVEEITSTVQDVISQAGLEFQIRPSLSADQLGDHIKLVVALPPITDLQNLVSASQGTKFLAINIPDISESPDLVAMNSIDGPPDQLGFMAGVISAIITEDWRVASITQSDNPADQVMKEAFTNGVAFFCGLCRPTYPPFYTYPLSLEIPAGSSQAELQALVDSLSDSYIETVFVSPAAGEMELYQALSDAGIHIISSGDPPPGLRDDWVVSLDFDLTATLQQVVSDLLEGKEVAQTPLPLVLNHANPALFSPGRQYLANKYLAEMLAGFIDTGLSTSFSNNGGTN